MLLQEWSLQLSVVSENPTLDERSTVLNLSLIPIGWIKKIIWNSSRNKQSKIIKIPKFKTIIYWLVLDLIHLIKNKNVRTSLDFSEGSKSSTRIDALSVSLWALQ